MPLKSTVKIAVGIAATVAIFVVGAAPAMGFGGSQLIANAAVVFLKAYHAAPALMLVIIAAVGLLALSGMLAILRAVAGFMPGESASDEDLAEEPSEPPRISHRAYVEVQIGRNSIRRQPLNDMLRIGREYDNDIRIPSEAVQLYHAAIHREDYDDWHITELATAVGEGLVVNGHRCREAQLHDGDIIQLGPGKLRFHAAYA